MRPSTPARSVFALALALFLGGCRGHTGGMSSDIASTAPEEGGGWGSDACTPAPWAPASTARGETLLGASCLVRNRKLIADFSWENVTAQPTQVGRGGIFSVDPLTVTLRGCSDSPWGQFAAPGTSYSDPDTGLAVTISAVDDAGSSGRGWTGVRCSYRLVDNAHPQRVALLAADAVPPFNELSGLFRDGNAIIASLSYNGYAKDINGRGNRLVAADLCTGEVVWTSPDLTVNGHFLVIGDYIVSSYGFTKEDDWIYVIDKGTGRVISKHAVPAAPEALRLVEEGSKTALYARLYDGYARFVVKQDAAAP